MSREELQKQSLQLIKEHNRIALQWCTGLGKSRAAMQAANYLAEQKEDLKVLLVVAEVAHKENWEEEFVKWDYKVPETIIECYASLKKYRDTEWDLIIFDEAHHLGSDLRMDILTSIKAKNVILLSATLPDHILQSISDIFGEFTISKVTLKQAIDLGFLPKPKVFLIPLTLDSTYKNCTITEEWGRKEKKVKHKCTFNERWEYLRNRNKYPNVTLEISCTQRQKYDYLTDQFDFWRNQFLRTRQEFAKNKWLQAGSKRKRFLGECKTDAVRVLLHKIQDKRFICFCSSIEQAEVLGGKNAIHSKRENSLDIIDKFNTKHIDSLFAVGMLQEGQNLTNIEAGIIVQLDGQERAFVQKFGRSLRADDPIQFIFYYENTRDEEYLENVIEGIEERYIIKIPNLLDFIA